MTDPDGLVGPIAVEWGLIDPATLDRAIGDLLALRRTQPSARLEQILIRERLVTPQAIAELRHESAWRHESPDVVSRFEFLGLLGQGGMSRVHLVVDRPTGRRAALKVLRRGLAPGMERRFEREARALSRIESRHVVGLLDWGQAGERRYLLLAHVAGRSLEDLLAADSTRPRGSGSSPRRPSASRPSTRPASSTATSSRATSSGPRTGGPSCSTSDSPTSTTRASP